MAVKSTAERVQFAIGIALIPVIVSTVVAAVAMYLDKPEAFAQHLVNGLTLGGLFALIALGYTMVYGIVELINFAHGEVFMVGSFLGLIAIQVLFGWGITSIWLVLPLATGAAMVGCAALGVSLDSIAYKPLRRNPTWSSVGAAIVSMIGLTLVLQAGMDGRLTFGRIGGAVVLMAFAVVAFRLDERNPSPPRSTPRINALLSAIGMSILLQNLVRIAVGSDTQTFPQMDGFTGLPLDGDGSVITSFTLPVLGRAHTIEVLYLEVFTIVSAVVLMVALDVLVNRTKLGKGMRAISQDPEAAMMLGIPVNRVITMTFVLGSGLAAAAGILHGLKYGGVKFFDGFIIGLKAFIAAVLGGIGNIRGAMLGGFVLGLSETVIVATMEYGWLALGRIVHGPEAADLWPQAEFFDYKDVIAFLILVAVLTVRPWGLLGTPEIDKV